ncbi:MAG: hypothetical protein JKY65_08840 [Planctomycetes bacterium]|nr:hypothetical protein [Planctomycetota bacterium]
MIPTDIRLATPADAPDLIRAIRACYGTSYLQPSALRGSRLAQDLADGSLVYAMARTEGRVVGQVALERLNQHGLYHHCRAVVSPGSRGQGLMRAMSAHLLRREAIPVDAQLVLGTSVTSHTFTQRYNLRAGFTPLGLLLGVHPNQTLEDLPRMEEAGSAVLMALPLTAHWRPRHLALSGPARRLASRVCGLLGIPLGSGSQLSTGSLWTQWEEGPGGLWHLRYHPHPTTYGGPPVGAALEWVDVPAEHVATPELLERWEGAGLSLAAYLPLAGPLGEDVIRLQRCRRSLTRSSIEVLEEIRPLRDWVFRLHSTTREPVSRLLDGVLR